MYFLLVLSSLECYAQGDQQEPAEHWDREDDYLVLPRHQDVQVTVTHQSALTLWLLYFSYRIWNLSHSCNEHGVTPEGSGHRWQWALFLPCAKNLNVRAGAAEVMVEGGWVAVDKAQNSSEAEKTPQASQMAPGKSGRALFPFRLLPFRPRQSHQHLLDSSRAGFLFTLVSPRKGQSAALLYLLWRREHYLALQPAQRIPGADKLEGSATVIYICNGFVSSAHSLSPDLTISVIAGGSSWLTLVSWAGTDCSEMQEITKWSLMFVHGQHAN